MCAIKTRILNGEAAELLISGVRARRRDSSASNGCDVGNQLCVVLKMYHALQSRHVQKHVARRRVENNCRNRP